MMGSRTVPGLAAEWAEEMELEAVTAVEGDKAIVEKRKNGARSRRKLCGILDRCDQCQSDDPRETACGFSNGSTIDHVSNNIEPELLHCR